MVWRYLFRRDDPSPAPWTKEGQKISTENGYVCIFPDGYAEAQALKELKKAEKMAQNSKGKGNKIIDMLCSY